MTTTINMRIDSRLKEKVTRKFKQSGLNLSAGTKFVFTQIANGEIDLGPKMHYEMTPKQEKWVRKQVEEARRTSKGYKTAKELFDDILKR